MKRFIFVIYNVVAFALVLEAVSLVHFAWTEGGLYYTAGVERAVEETAAPDTEEITRLRIHPYFGIVTHPGTQVDENQWSNNYGFISTLDYPFTRTNEDQYLVGMFGGSVSGDFFHSGLRRVKQALLEYPGLEGRRIVLLNFAMGGYKQPQQLQILAYFLAIGQTFDLVINMDGFNDLVFASINEEKGIEASMPSRSHFLKLIELTDRQSLTTEQIESVHTITGLREKLAVVNRRANKARLAASHLFWSLYGERLQHRYTKELQQFNEREAPEASASLVHLKGRRRELSEDEALAKAADLWAASSFQMAALCEANGIDYVHFIQPNQYYTGKTLTKAELLHAHDESKIAARIVRKGYPLLEARLHDLVDRGVAAYSAVEVFDNVIASLYVDDCCHFNQQGNLMLGDFVADVIIRDILGESPATEDEAGME